MSEILQRGYASRNQFLSVAQLYFKDTIKRIFIDKDQEVDERLQGSPERRTSSQTFFSQTCEFWF